MKFEPYYQSKTQRLFRFPNGYGASVVRIHDNTHEVAPIRFEGQGLPDGSHPSFYIDYHTPLGRPKSGLSEEDAMKIVGQIAGFEPPAKDDTKP